MCLILWPSGRRSRRQDGVRKGGSAQGWPGRVGAKEAKEAVRQMTMRNR